MSPSGGLFPTWSITAQQLLFVEARLKPRLLAAPYVIAGDSFRAETPKLWSPTSIRSLSPGLTPYACTPTANERRR